MTYHPIPPPFGLGLWPFYTPSLLLLVILATIFFWLAGVFRWIGFLQVEGFLDAGCIGSHNGM